MSVHQNDYRLLELLHWVDALNQGYAVHRNVRQPATLGNITYYMLDAGCRREILSDKYGRFAYSGSSNFSQEVYDDMKNLVNTMLRLHLGVMFTREKIELDKDMCAPVRNGFQSRAHRCNAYELTANGKRKKESKLQKSREWASEVNSDTTTDTIVIPVENRFGWDTETVTLPRVKVIEGTIVSIDTGKVLKES